MLVDGSPAPVGLRLAAPPVPKHGVHLSQTRAAVSSDAEVQAGSHQETAQSSRPKMALSADGFFAEADKSTYTRYDGGDLARDQCER